MPTINRHPGAERTILFPFDPSSLLATLADWAHGQGAPNRLSWRARRAPGNSEQPAIGVSDAGQPSARHQHE